MWKYIKSNYISYDSTSVDYKKVIFKWKIEFWELIRETDIFH